MKKKILVGILFILLIVMSLNVVLAVEEDTEQAQEEEVQGDWTDFSNAKYEIVKESPRALLKISGVTLKDDHIYHYFILKDGSKSDISNKSKDKNDSYMGMFYNSKFFVKDGNIIIDISKKVELNQDLYFAVIEEYDESIGTRIDKIVTYGTKLTRPQEPKFTDAFFATYMANDSTQIITNFTHEIGNQRKMQIKIGKITDISILQKIKNQDAKAFSELKNFAQSSRSIYDDVIDIKDTTSIENISYMTNGKLISLNGLEDKEYYYLYVKTDDENGKYFSNDAVSLAQSDVFEDGNWALFFYGSDDFKWTDFGNIVEDERNTAPTPDNTVAPTILPKTGIGSIIVIGIIVFVVNGIITAKKYKKYNY